MQPHGIRRQVQQSSSGSTPHDRPTIPQICSSRSLALDRRRQSALRYPAVVSNRANTYRVRRQSPPIHPPLRSRTTSAIAPLTISQSARGTQIPIAHAAPPTYPFPRFPPLEVCGRRPPLCAAPPSWGRHPKTFTISEVSEPLFDHPVRPREKGGWKIESNCFRGFQADNQFKSARSLDRRFRSSFGDMKMCFFVRPSVGCRIANANRN